MLQDSTTKGLIAMPETCALSSLERGVPARVCSLTTEGVMRRRLMDIGLTPGSRVENLFSGAWGEPTAYLICGAVVALRKEDAATVQVRSER